MNGFIEPLPGLLDDPYVQDEDLPILSNFHIAPLRNPAPSKTGNVLLPLEPLANDRNRTNVKEKELGTKLPAVEKGYRTTHTVKPRDLILAQNAKKPNLAISELVEAQQETHNEPVSLPSFISLAVIERSPHQQYLTLTEGPPPKRARLEYDGSAELDDKYRHLPLPAQKDDHFSTRPLPLLPAMVAGLHEPPLSAALLPSMELEGLPRSASKPIETTRKQSNHAKRPNMSDRRPPELMINSPELQAGALPSPSATDLASGMSLSKEKVESSNGKSEKKSLRRPRRKWTNVETEHLVAGVGKYGIGKWKQILQDKAYAFQNRSTVDLKDRFRVCSPQEYKIRNGGKIGETDVQTTASAGHTVKNILNRESNRGGTIGASTSLVAATVIHNRQTDDQSAAASTTYTRAERKETSAIRRKRCPWTVEEDDALIKGVARYGFHWTAIHADVEFGLLHRRATDLRDRVRNKFPDAYKFADSAPLRSTTTKLMYKKIRAQTPDAADIGLTSETGSLQTSSTTKRVAREHHGRSDARTECGNDSSQETIGMVLPPIVVEEAPWAWDNTLPPLEWEDMGI